MDYEFQKADENITFTHILNLKKTSPDDKIVGEFSTCYESTILDWELNVSQRCIRSDKTTGTAIWGIGLKEMMRGCSPFPPLVRVEFKITELNSDGSTTNSLKYVIDGLLLPRNNHFTVWTEKNCKFEKDFTSLMKKQAESDKSKLKLETLLEFQREDFQNAKYVTTGDAPIFAKQSAEFFESLSNVHLHNLKLKTSDERRFLMTNKEVLWIACPYFRPLLKLETKEYTVQGAGSVDCLDICVTYLVTTQYKKPEQMTPKLASEIIQVIRQLALPPAHEPLTKAVEKHCYEELCKNHEDIITVANFLIVGDDYGLYNLKYSCIANIISHHFNDFMRILVDGNHHLKNRLTHLATEVRSAFVSSKQTCSFIKFIPAEGEE